MDNQNFSNTFFTYLDTYSLLLKAIFRVWLLSKICLGTFLPFKNKFCKVILKLLLFISIVDFCSEDIWIGLVYVTADHVYWIDGTEYTGPSISSSDRNCIKVRVSGGQVQQTAAGCSDSNMFFCEDVAPPGKDDDLNRENYCQTSNISRTKSPKPKCFSSSLAFVFAQSVEARWSGREWRYSWSSADRRCSNYIWVTNIFIAF